MGTTIAFIITNQPVPDWWPFEPLPPDSIYPSLPIISLIYLL